MSVRYTRFGFAGLLGLLVAGTAAAHCGSCGVGESSSASHQHGPGHSHAEEHLAPQAKTRKKAPPVKLLDQDGSSVSLSDFKDKIVVLEWTNPDCPYVKRHYKAKTMKTLATKWAKKDVVWLAINSTHYADREANKKFATAHGLDYSVLSDPSGRVGRAYGAKTTPHMFIKAKDGTLVYDGAIDSDPYGDQENPTNLVDQALEALVAGKPVPQSENRSYGCSVKYPR